MISKPAFVEIINCFRAYHKKQAAIVNMWEKYFGADPPYFGADVVGGVVDALEADLGCEVDKVIQWWLWDAPNGIEGDVTGDVLLDENMNPIDVTTPAALYDHIIKGYNT